MAATLHLFFFFFLFSLIFLCNPEKIRSSSCTLDFSQFPYEAHGECFDKAEGLVPALTLQSCCRAALQSLFQSMAIRANSSRSIFLEPDQAQDCSTKFQNLHSRTNLSRCGLQNFISSSVTNSCPKNVDSVINVLGNERYNALQSNCRDLSADNYSDDACFNCIVSYRQSLQALRDVDGSNGNGCSAEALLVSLASSYINSSNWVRGTFSCLWDEIQFPWPAQNQKKGYLLGSKKLLAIIIVAASLVIITPILYKLTRKRLQDASEKEMENLSVIVLKKTLEDESRSPFTCSDLYIFSQDEMGKATNSYDYPNLIGEGTTGKFYIGIMPSGMRAAIKRINEGVKLHDFIDEICRKAKIRHPNLVSILGYCDRGDQCLVYEYCVNGDIASWLLGERRTPILTWEQRLQISIEIARGLWFLHNNPLEKMVHGDVKLTNILLNEKLEAKLSNSILSKSKLKETNGLETMANDVFNFGVVLLQILTGRKPKSLVNEAREAVLKGGSITAMADPRLNGAYVSIEFRNILSIAVLCTTPNERDRPSMEEILRKLEETQILV